MRNSFALLDTDLAQGHHPCCPCFSSRYKCFGCVDRLCGISLIPWTITRPNARFFTYRPIHGDPVNGAAAVVDITQSASLQHRHPTSLHSSSHHRHLQHTPSTDLEPRASPPPPLLTWVYEKIVVGGAINGQVLVWDISNSLTAIDQKKRKQSVRHIGKPGLGAGGDEDEPVAALPPVQPLAVSHIDMSHRRLVADLAWLPTSTQVRRSNLSIFEPPTQFSFYW